MTSPGRFRVHAVPLVVGLALGVGAGLAWLSEPAKRSLETTSPRDEGVDRPLVLAAPEGAPGDEHAEPLGDDEPTPDVPDERSDDERTHAVPARRVQLRAPRARRDSTDAGAPELHRPERRSESAPPPRFADAETYLLAGIDHTRGGGHGRADTLVVAIFDDASGHVGLVSIPRDLLVDVPGHGLARINATLRIAGRLGLDPLATLRDVVGEALGIPIRHVVLGDLGIFERTVDALGGVEVDVPCPIRDDFRDERTESGRRLLEVPAGTVRLDGATAAMYVRSRHGRSDWDRARRQQAVLFAMRARVRELGPAGWLPVFQAAAEGVETDLSRLELLALVRRVASVREERLHGILLGHREVHPSRTSEGQWVVVPDADAIARALTGLFDAPAPGVPHVHARCQPVDAALRPRVNRD